MLDRLAVPRRHAEPRIADPATHPRRSVCLEVAAAYLGMGARTVRARIESGELDAWHSGKVYRVQVADLVAYRKAHHSANQ